MVLGVAARAPLSSQTPGVTPAMRQMFSTYIFAVGSLQATKSVAQSSSDIVIFEKQVQAWGNACRSVNIG